MYKYIAKLICKNNNLTKTYGIIEKVFDKNIEIKLDLEENLFVQGNHSLLSQGFLNLFTNARGEDG